MNDIKNYFTSPMKMMSLPLKDRLTNSEKSVSSTTTAAAMMVVVSSLASSSSSLSTRSPSSLSPPLQTNGVGGPAATSKLIVSNMESVISSVKKHRKARRKKRETVEPEISDISAILSNSLSFVAGETTPTEATAQSFDIGKLTKYS